MNTIGSPTYNIAKHLAKNLKPLAGNTYSYIKYSTHFNQEIKNLQLKDNDMLVSFDVISLYTKFLVDEVLKCNKRDHKQINYQYGRSVFELNIFYLSRRDV